MIKIGLKTSQEQVAISHHTGSQSQLRTSPRKTHNAIKSAEERAMGVRVNATPEHAVKAILASAKATLHAALNKGTGKLKVAVLAVVQEPEQPKAFEKCICEDPPWHMPDCPTVGLFAITSPEWNRSKEPKPNTGRRVGVWKD